MTNLNNDSDSNLLVHRPLRRLVIALTALFLFGLFIFWRIDNERMAAVRADLVDRLLPAFEIGMSPVNFATDAFKAIGDFSSVVDRVAELEEENRRLQEWRQRAIALEQQNAALREVANVQLSGELPTISAQVTADTSGAFRNSVLVNVGRRNGVSDGWAVLDGSGLLGRISGVGRTSSRVMLLTDSSSQVPIKIKPSGARGIVSGNNRSLPLIRLVSNLNQISPGDSVYTSGDGGVFPPDLLVGTVSIDQNGQVGVSPAANLGNLEFVIIIRSRPPEAVEASSDILVIPSRGNFDQATGR